MKVGAKRNPRLHAYMEKYGVSARKVRLIGLDRLDAMTEDARDVMLNWRPKKGGTERTQERYRYLPTRTTRKPTRSEREDRMIELAEKARVA